jgi:hypothetical protein
MRPGDSTNSFPSYRYWTRLSLAAPEQVKEVEITNLASGSILNLSRATLYNSGTGISTPLSSGLRSEFWKTVYDQAQVQVLENTRAQPRAWLVIEAEAVDAEEALRRIRGESAHEFDPQRTALLEVKPADLPQLPGRVAAGSRVLITSYSDTRLTLETDSSTPTVLVVSEIFYPGWVATVDGRQADILLTDYLLRGLSLPPGQHKIEMRYTAPAARTGAIISGCALLLLCGLFAHQRRAGKK